MGRGANRRIDHQQQLHQRVVRRQAGLGVAAGRLDDEHVGAADRLLIAAIDLAVGERLQGRRPKFDGELGGDVRGELRRRAAREQHQPLVVVDRETGDGWLRLSHAHPRAV
jgi:hypothetical protein